MPVTGYYLCVCGKTLLKSNKSHHAKSCKGRPASGQHVTVQRFSLSRIIDTDQTQTNYKTIRMEGERTYIDKNTEARHASQGCPTTYNIQQTGFLGAVYDSFRARVPASRYAYHQGNVHSVQTDFPADGGLNEFQPTLEGPIPRSNQTYATHPGHFLGGALQDLFQLKDGEKQSTVSQNAEDNPTEDRINKKKKKKFKKPGKCFALTFKRGIKYSLYKYFSHHVGHYDQKDLKFSNIKYVLIRNLVKHRAVILKNIQRQVIIESKYRRLRYITNVRMKKHFKAGINELLVSNKKTISEDNIHCHLFLRTTNKLWIAKVQKTVGRNFKCLGDIEACKSPKTFMKYVTKEDTYSLLYDIDIELAHHIFQMYYVARHFKPSMSHYGVRKWLSSAHKVKFRAIDDEVNNKKCVDKAYESAVKYSRKDLLQEMKSSYKKGIFLYGPPGTGKTSTAIHFCEKDMFYYKPSKFAFDNYNDEQNIIWDNANRRQFMSPQIQEFLKNMTDDSGIVVGKRKRGTAFLIQIKGKFIVTANFCPPEFTGFNRRFHCIHVDSLEVLFTSSHSE